MAVKFTRDHSPYLVFAYMFGGGRFQPCGTHRVHCGAHIHTHCGGPATEPAVLGHSAVNF